MRPSAFLAARRFALLPLAAALAAPLTARAAADDQVGAASPVAAPAGRTAATTTPPADDTVGAAPAIAPTWAQAAASRQRPVNWRRGLGTPYVAEDAGAARAADADDANPSDTPDLPLGARWRVVHGDAASHVPAASWMPDLQNVDARITTPRAKTNLSGEWALPNDFSVGVMPGMAVDYSAEGRRLATGTIAVTLGKAWTPQWRTFVDMARDRLAAMQLSGVSTSVDAGVSFVATPGTQIDFAVTRGLSDTAPPFQAGLGLSSSF